MNCELVAGAGPAPAYPGHLVLVAEDQGTHHNGWEAFVEQPGEQQVELGQVKSLTAIQDTGNRPAALVEVLLQHLLHLLY